MSITFRCEHCHKDVKAPDDAAGRRGKCPHCGQTSYIPTDVGEEDVLDLAPIDEQEEQERRRKEHQLAMQERQLLSETAEGGDVPLDHREDLKPEDTYHFVVNYCLNMSRGKLPQARMEADKLRKFGYTGIQAVEDFETGKAIEPSMDVIPKKVLHGFLKQLKEDVKRGR